MLDTREDTVLSGLGAQVWFALAQLYKVSKKKINRHILVQ